MYQPHTDFCYWDGGRTFVPGNIYNIMNSDNPEPAKPACYKPEWKWPAFVIDEGNTPPLKVLLHFGSFSNT